MYQKKKILHLITGLDIGGAEKMLLRTLPRMQNDFDHLVCCIRGHGPIGQELKKAGIPVFYLDLHSILDIGSVFRFRRIIHNSHPDILVTNLIHADLFGRIFGRIFGIKKIVCYQHGQLLQWEFLRIIDRATKFLVTKYIVQTDVAKKELMQKLHLPEEKFEVISNSIDSQEFITKIDGATKRQELHLLPEDTIITCVSNLRRRKGHEYLLKAFEELFLSFQRKGNQNTLKLLIVGDGEQKEKLLDQIHTYQSKAHIRFLGNRNDVKEILKISDLFILPTLGEGMSVAIMEAMATGLPIITTDIPENRELIENQITGILVPPKDTPAITDAIERLLNDKPLRLQLGKNAQKKIQEQFDSHLVKLKLAHFYNNL